MAQVTVDPSTNTVIVDGAPSGATQSQVAEALSTANEALNQADLSTKKYTHTQSTSATTWNVAHNLGTTSVIAMAFNGSSQSLDATVAVVDANNVTITLGTASTGTAVVIG